MASKPGRVLTYANRFIPETLKSSPTSCLKFINLKRTMNLSFLGLPCVFKLADITPIHQKKSGLHKSNYVPVSLLPNILKVSENLF